MNRDYENISCAVKKLSNRFRRRLFSDDSRRRLSHAEGRTVHFILSNQDRDIFQKDIQDRFGIRASSASSQIKNLEREGLIKRVSIEDDRRLKRIVPTEKLLSEKEYIDERSRKLNEKLVKGISDEDLDVFLRVINRMIDNMEDDG